MADTPPSDRRLGKAAIYIVAILAAVIIAVFVGMNVWHGQELKEDQARGDNLATAHEKPMYERDQ